MAESMQLMSIEEAFEKFGPQLAKDLCKGCDLKPICDHFNTSCRLAAILERLFLTGRITYEEATQPITDVSPQMVLIKLGVP